MGYILGAGIIFYIVYAICAGIFKHKAGWIIATVLGVIMSIGVLIGSGSVGMLISMIVVSIIVYFWKKIHIRDYNKFEEVEDDCVDTEEDSDSNE